jgi:hypothetical protein
MSMSTYPIRSAARPRWALVALVVALGLVLAACGADGGDGGNGGNGGSGYKLKAAIINETSADVEASLNGGTPVTVPTCDAVVETFDLPDADWTLTVGGVTALESVNLESNLLGRNLTAEVQLNADSTVTINNISAGAFIQTPSKTGICN